MTGNLCEVAVSQTLLAKLMIQPEPISSRLLCVIVEMVLTLRAITFAEMTYATSELIIKPSVDVESNMEDTRLQATASRASRLPMCQFERQSSEVKSITED